MASLIITIISLLLLCFLQGSESALLYSFKYREADEDDPSFKLRILAHFYDKADRMLTGLHVASFILICTILYSGNDYLQTVLPSLGLPLADTLLRLVIIGIVGYVTAFVLARSYGARWADNWISACAMPLYLLNLILLPLAKAAIWLPRILLGKRHQNLLDQHLLSLTGTKGITSERPNLTPDLNATPIQEGERKLLRNAIDFSSVKVRDCIVPRTEIQAIEWDSSLSQLMKLFTSSGKTKIIVYRDDIDHIVGYIHSSEMFRQDNDTNWHQHVSDIPVVPESMSAQKMLHLFLRNKKSLAVVADEFGGTTGIISLEDLVEEIFGDIEDEHDTQTLTSRQITPNEYLLSARLETEKVNEQYGLHLPLSDEYITIGGLILYYNEAFPKENQTIDIPGYQFRIIKTQRSKIELVRLKTLPNSKK